MYRYKQQQATSHKPHSRLSKSPEHLAWNIWAHERARFSHSILPACNNQQSGTQLQAACVLFIAGPGDISLFSYLWSHRMVLKPESGWTFSDAQCAVLRHFLKGMCCAVCWSYYDEHSPLFGWWEQPPSIEYLYFNLYTLKFSIKLEINYTKFYPCCDVLLPHLLLIFHTSSAFTGFGCRWWQWGVPRQVMALVCDAPLPRTNQHGQRPKLKASQHGKW